MAAPLFNPIGDFMTTDNALTWFEIPVHDMARAQAFYERLLGATLRLEEMGGSQLAVFPYDPAKGVGGPWCT
jgi:uncharacterized protein